MNFVRFVTATSCYCCYSVCFVWSAAISASMVLPFRNLQARGVHGGKLWFIQLLYSCYYWLSQKKKNTSHGLWKDLDDLRLPVWKTDHLSLPFTPSCQDPWSPGLPGPGLQRVTSAATCLHPWAWSGSGRAGHRLSGQLGRGSLWVWVSLGFIWHP